VIQQLADLTGDESWDELREHVGHALGLDRPVPGGVLRRAMVDSEFAHRLLVSRGSPGFLAALIDEPKNQAYELPGFPPDRLDRTDGTVPGEATPRSNGELARRAAKALIGWGRAGFTQVDDQTYERRLDACRACPHLVQPPQKLVYRIGGRGAEDPRICDLCGCVVTRKARLPREQCPGADPADPARTRWGEPREDVHA
jgi:hypothetical protein